MKASVFLFGKHKNNGRSACMDKAEPWRMIARPITGPRPCAALARYPYRCADGMWPNQLQYRGYGFIIKSCGIRTIYLKETHQRHASSLQRFNP
jgi:hypothetical protein